MSTDAGSVRVNIFNQTYSLRSASGDGEHVLRVARLVDERMRAVASGLAVHDVAKVAVLTALNLADELEGLKSFYETELRGMLERARRRGARDARARARGFRPTRTGGRAISARDRAGGAVVVRSHLRLRRVARQDRRREAEQPSHRTSTQPGLRAPAPPAPALARQLHHGG